MNDCRVAPEPPFPPATTALLVELYCRRLEVDHRMLPWVVTAHGRHTLLAPSAPWHFYYLTHVSVMDLSQWMIRRDRMCLPLYVACLNLVPTGDEPEDIETLEVAAFHVVMARSDIGHLARVQSIGVDSVDLASTQQPIDLDGLLNRLLQCPDQE